MPDIVDHLPKSVYTTKQNKPLAERIGYIELMDKNPGKWVSLISVAKKKRQKIYNQASYFRKAHPEYEWRCVSTEDKVSLYGRLA
tara:strand:+ start:2647 stop:2901 length:255 start_codon:yes stop_codon:yes gene_type:complete